MRIRWCRPSMRLSITSRLVNSARFWNVRATPLAAMVAAPARRSSVPSRIDRAGLRTVDAVEAVEDRGLARAVGADDREQLTGEDVEVDARQGRDAAEAQRQVADGEQRRRARLDGSPSSRSARHRGHGIHCRATTSPAAESRERGLDLGDAEVELADVGVVEELRAGGPARTTRPVSSTYPWYAMESAIDAFCSTSSMLVPAWLIATMMSRIWSTIIGARPSEGSSSSSSRGRPSAPARSRASAARRRTGSRPGCVGAPRAPGRAPSPVTGRPRPARSWRVKRAGTEVLLDGQLTEDPATLHHLREPRRTIGAGIGPLDTGAVELHGARGDTAPVVHAQEPRARAEQRRLAGTVRAEQRDMAPRGPRGSRPAARGSHRRTPRRCRGLEGSVRQRSSALSETSGRPPRLTVPVPRRSHARRGSGSWSGLEPPSAQRSRTRFLR